MSLKHPCGHLSTPFRHIQSSQHLASSKYKYKKTISTKISPPIMGHYLLVSYMSPLALSIQLSERGWTLVSSSSEAISLRSSSPCILQDQTACLLSGTCLLCPKAPPPSHIGVSALAWWPACHSVLRLSPAVCNLYFRASWMSASYLLSVVQLAPG